MTIEVPCSCCLSSDPEQLATLADRRLKACHDDIVESLRGVVTEQHRGALRRHLQTIDHIMAMVGEIDAEVAALLEPFHRQVALLDTIPGVDIASATVIVAGIGVDMSRFPSSGHLVSWAGLCPRADESAGKRRNTQIGKGGQWLKTTLVQAAWAAVRKKEEHHLKSLFLRLKSRRGAKKAIIAVAASMMNSVWFMLTRDQPYRDPEGTAQDPAKKATEAARLVRKLKTLGYDVALPTAA